MSKRAWFYIWSVFVASTVLCVFAIRNVTAPIASQWLPCLVLTVLATLSQLYEADAQGRNAPHPHAMFFFAGVLLLDPRFFFILVAVPHLVEWVAIHWERGEHRRNWYVQPLNIAVYIIMGALTRSVYVWLLPDVTTPHSPLPMIAGTAAALTYMLTNRLIVGQVLVLVHGTSWRAAGIWNVKQFSQEFVTVYLGYSVAVLWNLNPWYVVPAVAPLLLVYQALRVPQLTYEAQTDSKTGLLNTRYFDALLAEELDRARRFSRPLAIVMADLDFMRNINNTYGHVAGDAVLAGIAQVLRATVREFDLVGRFGGEEFVIALPEAQLSEAQAIAERIRAAVETTPFESSTSTTPMHATMSIGVACFPHDATTLTELMHAADVALYRAKAQGRNCVVCVTDVVQDAELAALPDDPARPKAAPAIAAARGGLEHARRQAARAAQAQPLPVNPVRDGASSRAS